MSLQKKMVDTLRATYPRNYQLLFQNYIIVITKNSKKNEQTCKPGSVFILQ